MSNRTTNAELHDSVEALKDDLTSFKSDVVTLLENLAAEGKDKSEDVAEAAREKAESGFAAMKERVAQARDCSREAIDTSEQTIRKHPFLSVAVAVGAGALVGRFLRRG